MVNFPHCVHNLVICKKSQFILKLAGEVRCRFSLWSNPCYREHKCWSFFGKPSNSNLPTGRWNQKVVRCHRWLRGCLGSDVLDVPQTFCRHLPCTHWQIRNRSRFWFQAFGQVEQAKWCGSFWKMKKTFR